MEASSSDRHVCEATPTLTSDLTFYSLLRSEFVAASVRHILSLYPPSSRPSSVLIIAHSMGGVVAQALFTLPSFPPSLVSTIITLSSPLARPVITFDPSLLGFYGGISEVTG